jgi:hypothetical protein
MTTDVFLSVGRTATDQQEDFVREVERLLLEYDLKPRNLGRSDYSAAQPLRAIEELMDQCSGTVIVAFERLYVESGIDRRGSEHARPVSAQTVTTVWNQIEAAMAYVKRQPLLVIVEESIVQQGLLSHGADWYVQQVPLDPTALRSAETIGRLDDWKRRVMAHAESQAQTISTSGGPVGVEKMTIAELVGALKPAQLYAAIGAVLSLLAGAFLVARQLP